MIFSSFLIPPEHKVMAIILLILPFKSYAQTESAATNVVGAAFGIGMLLISLLFVCLGIALFIFWIVMFVDCVKRDFDQKGLWLAILGISLFVGLCWLSAPIYYFQVRKKNLGNKITA